MAESKAESNQGGGSSGGTRAARTTTTTTREERDVRRLERGTFRVIAPYKSFAIGTELTAKQLGGVEKARGLIVRKTVELVQPGEGPDEE